jgi:hypothetical protein
VVDSEGEDHAGSCQWTRSSERRAQSLDQGTREARLLIVVVDTSNTNGSCWGPSASEGPQKHDLTMFLEV